MEGGPVGCLKQVAVFLVAVAAGAGTMIVLGSYYGECPCGFEREWLTGGCEVVLGPVPCGDGTYGGVIAIGSDTSHDSGGGAGSTGGGTGVMPPSTGAICPALVTKCTASLSPHTASLTYDNNSGVKYLSGKGTPVKLKILSKGCIEIAGTLTPPDPNLYTFKIPLNVSNPISGLQYADLGSCPGNPVTIEAYPDFQKTVTGPSPQSCGCEVTVAF